jgi:hypothetical protein
MRGTAKVHATPAAFFSSISVSTGGGLTAGAASLSAARIHVSKYLQIICRAGNLRRAADF